MTVAEVLLFVVVCAGVYFLLRPLQRWLERRLSRVLRSRHPRAERPMIDVTDFRSYASHNKDDDEHEHGA